MWVHTLICFCLQALYNVFQSYTIKSLFSSTTEPLSSSTVKNSSGVHGCRSGWIVNIWARALLNYESFVFKHFEMFEVICYVMLVFKQSEMFELSSHTMLCLSSSAHTPCNALFPQLIRHVMLVFKHYKIWSAHTQCNVSCRKLWNLWRSYAMQCLFSSTERYLMKYLSSAHTLCYVCLRTLSHILRSYAM